MSQVNLNETGIKKFRKGKGPLAGVCAGIGIYTGIPPIIVRIAFVVLPFLLDFFWIGLFIYIVLAIFMPKANREHKRQYTAAAVESLQEKKKVACPSCNHKNAPTQNFCVNCEEQLF